MDKKSLILTSTICLSFGLIGFTRPAYAEGCTLNTIQGSYGILQTLAATQNYTTSSTASAPITFGQSLPQASEGIITFTPHVKGSNPTVGQVTAFTMNRSYGGVLETFTGNTYNRTPPFIYGNYTVNADCTGAAHIFADYTAPGVTGGTREIDLNFVIVQDGSVVLAVGPDGDTTGSYMLSKTKKSCQVSDLSGSFGLTQTLAAANAQSGFGSAHPQAAYGVATFDGNGVINVTATSNLGGSTESIGGPGSYTVNADCTGTATFGTYTLSFVVAGNGNDVFALRTDASTSNVESFLLLKQ